MRFTAWLSLPRESAESTLSGYHRFTVHPITRGSHMPIHQSHLRPVTAPSSSSDGISGEPAGRQQRGQHAAKALPTDRMKMDRQLAVLHAIGRLSGPRKESVNGDALSRAVDGITPATVILSNRFFEAAGWITAPGKGLYAATDALVEYTRRLSTGTPGHAVEALRAPARQSWFWEALEPHFAGGARLSDSDALILLMRAADAGDHHLPNLRNVIAWLEQVGMVTVQGQHIMAKNADLLAAFGGGQAQRDHQEPAGGPPAEADGGNATKPGGGEPPATVVAFSFDVRVTADDLQRLTADQIRALFEAVGTVMAIKQGS